MQLLSVRDVIDHNAPLTMYQWYELTFADVATQSVFPAEPQNGLNAGTANVQVGCAGAVTVKVAVQVEVNGAQELVYVNVTVALPPQA